MIPTINFIFDRHHRADNSTKGSIELRITFKGARKYISTGIKCYPWQWDERKECVRSVDDVGDNENLLRIRKRALKVIGDMVDDGHIDLDAIPSRIKQRTLDITFVEYIYKRIKERQVTESTKKSYRAFLARLLDYGKINLFSDVTEKNVRDFDEYLHRFRWVELDRFGKEIQCQYSQPSIGHFHKKLKLFIGDAIIDGYIKENPYTARRIRIDRGGTRIDQYLTSDEVDRIRKSVMPTASLNETRDLFVFQCMTGLSYSDLMDFDFTKIKLNGEYQVYSSKRQKTGVEFTFVLIPEAIEILEKYNYHLPHLPNQKYNMKLKIMADAAGIDKNITTHVGRRTAGSIWLNRGVPIAVVSKCMGHRSIATTQKSYVKILDNTVVEAFEKHVINHKGTGH